MARRHALLLAGGKGLRAGGDIPKQFQEICGRPLLWWSLRAFHSHDPETDITVVMNPEYAGLWQSLLSALPEDERIPHCIAPGGKERGESVMNGLRNIKERGDACEDILVAVHDGARPLITPEMIERGFDMAAEYGNAVPYKPLTDSIRHLNTTGQPEKGSGPADRSAFVCVQTPQIFKYDTLCEAYAKSGGLTFTDDASLAEQALGLEIALYEGESSNIKVTNPEDFAIAETLLGLLNSNGKS